MVAVAIGPDSRRGQSQKVLEQIAGENVFRIDDYQSLVDAEKDVLELICRMYLTTLSSPPKRSCCMLIVNDEKFVKNNSKR